ncbi:MAG: GEVED domain-containing protein [Saprospiraceae bacterium]
MIRYLLLFTLFFSFSFQGFTQSIAPKVEIDPAIAPLENDKQRCGTPEPDEHTLQNMMDIISNEQQLAAQRNNVTDCLPMKIHIIREDDGSGGLSLGDLAIAMANLNYVYYDADIEFYVCDGINYVNNSDWYNFNAQEGDSETAFCTPVQVTDAINVFFMNSIVTSSGVNAAGYARYPFNSLQANRIFMINSVANNAPNSTFSHELGHYFNLAHTHNGTEFGPLNSNAERVVRTGTDANCDTDGDFLCDTDADPRYDNANFNFGTCSYTGSEQDDLGVTYTPVSAVNNIMSYYPDQCGGVFTPGQFTRIAAGLVTRQGHTAYNYSCTASAVTTPTGMTATLNGSQIDLSWTDNASNELGYIIERSSTSSTDGFLPIIYGGVGEDITSFTDTEDIANNTTYYYRVRPVASACDNYSNVASVTTGLIYCSPSYFSPCTGVNSILDDFSMDGDGGANEINNLNTDCNATSHQIFTNLSAAVTAESTYSFTACRNLGNTRFLEIWVDWNIDGDFDDAGEQMLNSTISPSPCYTGSITVPATAISGTTIMRIILANGGAPTAPCGSYSFGEAEDYSLVVDGVGGLPVELTSFRGNLKNEAVELSWRTESEVDNDFFTLERSKDGVNFESIAKVNGAGTSDRAHDYTHFDYTPFDGVNYYRLMQTDFNGEFTYSDIIQVSVISKSIVSVNVFPNPVGNDEFSLIYNAVTKGKVQYRITDLAGKTIDYQEVQVEKGKNNFSIDINNLNRGAYFLQTNQNNITKVVKFIRL